MAVISGLIITAPWLSRLLTSFACPLPAELAAALARRGRVAVVRPGAAAVSRAAAAAEQVAPFAAARSVVQARRALPAFPAARSGLRATAWSAVRD